jgi:hypothetical protein
MAGGQFIAVETLQFPVHLAYPGDLVIDFLCHGANLNKKH